MTIETPSGRDTEALALARRSGWPEELRLLIARYPREQWQGHDNLGAMARFWLSRHDMFRELGASIEAIDRGVPRRHAGRGRISGANWCRGCNSCCRSSTSTTRSRICTTSRFSAPPRSGSPAASTCWKRITTPSTPTWRRRRTTANALLRALAGDKDALARCGDDYAAASGALIKGLTRHLDDEEDLIVPLILDRGEDALGVGH